MFGPGEVIDIWEVEAALGQGGMGSVYRCHNQSAKRILAAIKVLDYGLKRSPHLRARFVREAEILFSLDHPHIVKVRNIRMDADPPYMEMSFVEGTSLEHRLAQGPLPMADALRVGRQIAGALAYLHDRGIRHRDVKPSNILVSPAGDATLVDFGIATESDGASLTESGQTFGSVCYVPPEWADPSGLDPVKWDLYALGLCIYEALTGRNAFESPPAGSARQRFFQVIKAKQEHPPLDPGPNFPVGLRTLVRALTEAEPARRPASAAAVVAQLDALDLGHVDAGHRFAEPPPRTPSYTIVPGGETAPGEGGKNRRWMAVGAVSVFVAAFGAGWVATRPAEDRAARVALPGDVAEISVDGAEAVAVVGGVAALRPSRPGVHSITLVRGVDCTLAAPSAWCGIETVPLEIPPGEGVADLTLSLAEPAVRRVTVATSDGVNFALEVAGEPAGQGTTVEVKLAPGKYAAEAVAGTCASEGTWCTPGSCPPGCAAWAGTIEVPWSADATVTLPLTAPPAPAAARTKAAPARAAATNAQLAKFLEGRAEWHRDAAIARGEGDENYLKGWEGAEPPAGKGASAVVGVSWALAAAYCKPRGGLADVSADPLTWTESGAQPWHELRQAGGRPAWRRSDGTTSEAVSTSATARSIGLRCAR